MSVAVSPDGRYLLTGSFNGGFVILCDLQTGQQIRRLDGLLGGIGFAVFSPDGKRALIGSGDGWRGTPARGLVLWDVETGQIVHELKGFDLSLGAGSGFHAMGVIIWSLASWCCKRQHSDSECINWPCRAQHSTG
jgi:WD40 repeat protein